MPTRVQVIKEARLDENKTTLCFHFVQYVYEDGTNEYGYRFIWRRDGRLLPSRGQARIPSIEALETLVAHAKREGWGEHKEGE